MGVNASLRLQMSSSQKTYLRTCAQRRFRSACAFAQSDLNLRWAHFAIAKDVKFLHADNEDSEQTARMRKLV